MNHLETQTKEVPPCSLYLNFNYIRCHHIVHLYVLFTTLITLLYILMSHHKNCIINIVQIIHYHTHYPLVINDRY